jgi:hypothetical protein
MNSMLHQFGPEDATELAAAELRWLSAARHWAAAAAAHRDARPGIARALGSSALAPRLATFLEAFAAAWSDPLVLAPSDCLWLLPDERALVDALRAASCEDENAFHAVLLDLVAPPVRERLYRLARRFGRGGRCAA